MDDRIFKLTGIENAKVPPPTDVIGFTGRNPTETFTASTPSVRSEDFVSVRDRAQQHMKKLESKEVSNLK